MTYRQFILGFATEAEKLAILAAFTAEDENGETTLAANGPGFALVDQPHLQRDAGETATDDDGNNYAVTVPATMQHVTISANDPALIAALEGLAHKYPPEAGVSPTRFAGVDG